MRTLALSTGILIGLVGCATPYGDIDTTGFGLAETLLVAKSQHGDKQAQYELGLRYAAGLGVPKDCARARKMLKDAAELSGGKIWVYSPPVTPGGAGRVIQLDTGPEQPGIPQAETALEIEGLCPVEEK